MPKKPNITDEEKAEFRHAMRGVKPASPEMRHQAHEQKPKPKPKLRKRTPEATDLAHPTVHKDDIRKEDWLSGEDCINFARNGVQLKLRQQMRRGQVPIEARIDLHQLTADEALEKVDRFMQNCRAQGIRWACIIHGKGRYSSDGKPIIKNVLNQWLRKHPSVLAFHSAQPKHGGTGALYVLLKR